MSKIKINVKENVTKRLGLKPRAEWNNMTIVNLKSVTTSEVEVTKGEYAGHTVPGITFSFEQVKTDKGESDRFYDYYPMMVNHTKGRDENAVERTIEAIESSYMEQWKHLKHIYDTFEGEEGYTEWTADVEFDATHSIEDRIKVMTALYKEFEEKFKAIDTVEIPLTLKTVASGSNNNYLAIPSFINKGFIEKTITRDGKFDTELEFTGAETYVLATSQAATPVVNDSAPAAELSEATKKIMGIK